ncbi:hypothetical protein [Flavobacterium sp.]|uniref:hypothetical protein n=1 Tax=Flavobacterium sp. TaxID=239 RepID=UPI00333E5E4C
MKQAVIMSKINGVVIKATYSRKNTPELSYSSKCGYCENDFLHSRNTAKYCSDKCRKRDFFRIKNIENAIMQKREWERSMLLEKQKKEESQRVKNLNDFVKIGKDLERSFKVIRLQNQINRGNKF